MVEPLDDLIEGWERIADAVDRSERWCLLEAATGDDTAPRLPVFYKGRTPCITRRLIAAYHQALAKHAERSARKLRRQRSQERAARLARRKAAARLARRKAAARRS